ncbi:MAG: hypothetical protein K0R41_2135 [Geminicoccaceae bacterium]|nr:hypothetical protein [Geminicoccaceae bacterium]
MSPLQSAVLLKAGFFEAARRAAAKLGCSSGFACHSLQDARCRIWARLCCCDGRMESHSCSAVRRCAGSPHRAARARQCRHHRADRLHQLARLGAERLDGSRGSTALLAPRGREADRAAARCYRNGGCLRIDSMDKPAIHDTIGRRQPLGRTSDWQKSVPSVVAAIFAGTMLVRGWRIWPRRKSGEEFWHARRLNWVGSKLSLSSWI